MSPRLLLLLAMVAAFFLLLLTLVRWGETFRLNSQYRQRLAQREGGSQSQLGALGKSPGLLPGLPGAQLAPTSVALAAPTPVPLHFVQLHREVASQVVSYLHQVSTVEQERQRVWRTWWNRALPAEPSPSPDPSSPQADSSPTPTLPLPDLIVAAAQWDRKIAGSLPDSTCLPFHLAYLHYLALEKDYIQRLVFAQQQGDIAECLRLQQEQRAVLGQAAQRVQARLRDLQREHPELSPDLRDLHIGDQTEIR